jgi:protein-tyrosine kinase
MNIAAAQAQPKGMHHDRNSAMHTDDVHSTLDQDRSIGDIIRETKSLTQDQINQILEYQRTNNLRFGESAVKLGLVSDADIVFALSQQFNYPYAPESRRANHRELVAAAQPFGKQAEAFRAIRSQLMMRIFNPQEPKRALAVTSPESGDGKTFLVANLGVVLAQLGGRTLIVDANLRNPRLHELFDLPNTSGLTGILSGRQEENVIYQAPDIPSLFVMPVGIIPPNPLELLERPAFRLLMSELLRKFDHVVVDTPASSLGSDALVIAARSGAAMTLARKNKTRVKHLHDLVGHLSETTAKLTGVIVNEF